MEKGEVEEVRGGGWRNGEAEETGVEEGGERRI